MIYRKSMLTTYIISVILLIPSLYANNLGTYHIQRESTVWIEGSSNINTFKCISYKVHGEGILDSSIKAAPIVGSPFNVRLKATFAITVKSMDCGNPMVNSDMYEALKCDDFWSNKLFDSGLYFIRILCANSKKSWGKFSDLHTSRPYILVPGPSFSFLS